MTTPRKTAAKKAAPAKKAAATKKAAAAKRSSIKLGELAADGKPAYAVVDGALVSRSEFAKALAEEAAK